MFSFYLFKLSSIIKERGSIVFPLEKKKNYAQNIIQMPALRKWNVLQLVSDDYTKVRKREKNIPNFGPKQTALWEDDDLGCHFTSGENLHS